MRTSSMGDANDSISPKLEIDGVEILSSTTKSRRLTPEENAKMTITGSQTAMWWDTAFHNVTAMLGAGVLGLPYAMTYLGWGGGVVALLYSWAVSVFTFQFLVYLHEWPNGVRMNRYHELTREVLGDFWGTWLLLPFQVTIFVGVPIAYAVTGGQSMHKVFQLLAPPGAHNPRVSYWIIIFSVVQLFVSQIKNFRELAWVSLFGSFSSVYYSMVAFIMCVVRGQQPGVTHSLTDGRDKVDVTFGIFDSLAMMMFAYGGHNIAMEIQATLPYPPSTVGRMMKGVWAAFILTPICYYTVAISGYWTFGRSVAQNVLISLDHPKGLIASANILVILHVLAGYQVLAFPLLDMFDAVGIRRGWDVGSLWWRLAVRSTFVVCVAVLACAIPFFGDLMGFLGAISVTPTTYLMPCILWLIVKKPRPNDWTFWFCYITLPIGFTIMLLGSAGAIRSIYQSAKTYGSFP